MKRRFEFFDESLTYDLEGGSQAELADAPEMVRKCKGIMEYGEAIFRKSCIARLLMECELIYFNVKDERHIGIPELKVLNGRNVFVFSALSLDGSTDLLMYALLDKHNRNIQKVFCYDLRNGINRQVDSVKDLNSFLDIVIP